MPESLYRPIGEKPGVELARVYPLDKDAPFFVDLVRMAGGASTEMHRQAGGYCYRLVAVTQVSGLSMMTNEAGRYEINEHVFLRPGEYLTRPRDFEHVFVNICCDEIVMMKALAPIDDCPMRGVDGDQPCICHEG
jgi:hypothetical protein